MGYIGMCGPKGCVWFLAILVVEKNRVSNLADFGHVGRK